MKNINQRRYRDGLGKIQLNQIYAKTNLKERLNIETSRQDNQDNQSNQDIWEAIEMVNNRLDAVEEKLLLPFPSDLENEEAGLVIYDAEATILQKGTEYWEEKKGLLGGTKMVKRTVK